MSRPREPGRPFTRFGGDPDEVAGELTEDELEARRRPAEAEGRKVADASPNKSTRCLHFQSGRPGHRTKARFQQAQRSATGTQQPQGIASGWLHQFNVLLQRAWLYKIRDEMVVITQVTMACIMALLLGAIYFQQGLSQASIQSRVGAISFSMLLMSFIAFDIVLLFPKERDLVYARVPGRIVWCISILPCKMLSRATRTSHGRRRLRHHRLLDDGLPPYACVDDRLLDDGLPGSVAPMKFAHFSFCARPSCLPVRPCSSFAGAARVLR